MSPDERSGAPARMQCTFIEADNEQPRDRRRFRVRVTRTHATNVHYARFRFCFLFCLFVESMRITRRCSIERVVA